MKFLNWSSSTATDRPNSVPAKVVSSKSVKGMNLTLGSHVLGIELGRFLMFTTLGQIFFNLALLLSLSHLFILVVLWGQCLALLLSIWKLEIRNDRLGKLLRKPDSGFITITLAIASAPAA